MNKTCAINLSRMFDMQQIQIQNPGGVKLDIPVPVQWGPEGHGAALSDCITPAEWSGVELQAGGEEGEQRSQRQTAFGQRAAVCVRVAGVEGAERDTLS